MLASEHVPRGDYSLIVCLGDAHDYSIKIDTLDELSSEESVDPVYLKTQLNQEVANEDYELAGSLRDLLKLSKK